MNFSYHHYYYVHLPFCETLAEPISSVSLEPSLQSLENNRLELYKVGPYQIQVGL